MKRAGPVWVRPAKEADAPLVLELIRELAAYEKLSAECTATEEEIRQTLFGREPLAEVLLAFERVNNSDGRALAEEAAAGFAVYFFNYSTFRAARILYLEDLFVRPAFRGRGFGKRLFQELIQIADRTGCARFRWSVLNWNRQAIEFYERLGAAAQPEWIGYGLERAQISRLAKEGLSG